IRAVAAPGRQLLATRQRGRRNRRCGADWPGRLRPVPQTPGNSSFLGLSGAPAHRDRLWSRGNCGGWLYWRPRGANFARPRSRLFAIAFPSGKHKGSPPDPPVLRRLAFSSHVPGLWMALGSLWGGLGGALVEPWWSLGGALGWPWGGSVLRSLCLVYASYMALGWLWVALGGRGDRPRFGGKF